MFDLFRIMFASSAIIGGFILFGLVLAYTFDFIWKQIEKYILSKK